MRSMQLAHNFVLDVIDIANDDQPCECIECIPICVDESGHGTVNGRKKQDDGVLLQ